MAPRGRPPKWIERPETAPPLRYLGPVPALPERYTTGTAGRPKHTRFRSATRAWYSVAVRDAALSEAQREQLAAVVAPLYDRVLRGQHAHAQELRLQLRALRGPARRTAKIGPAWGPSAHERADEVRALAERVKAATVDLIERSEMMAVELDALGLDAQSRVTLAHVAAAVIGVSVASPAGGYPAIGVRRVRALDPTMT